MYFYVSKIMYERKSVPIAIDSNMRIFEMYKRIGYDEKTCILYAGTIECF